LERMAHLKYLGDDMRAAKVSMTPAQRLLYMEAIFIEGHESTAIKEWREAGPLFAKQELSEWAASGPTRAEMYSKEYWELGIRMLSRAGHFNPALEATEHYLSDIQEPSTLRIVIPVIQALLASKQERTLQQAWALYVRLRYNLGDNMKMEDYDAVVSIFLASSHWNLASAVFKDMMLTGDTAANKEDSTALYTTTPDGLKTWKISSQELGWESTRKVGALPVRFRNKFFFGSWIKKLIGDGDLESAEKIFTLMQDHRICPSAIHVNGLIGAWFRQGTEKSRVLAEDMAWRMIKERLEFVKQRDLGYKLQGPIRTVPSKDLPDTKSINLTPPATIETFIILIEQYRRRQKQDRLSDLFDSFKQTKIQPNTIFMNQLLSLDTKSNRVDWAADTYVSLTSNGNVRPDLDTVSILWTIMKKIADPVHGSWKPSKPLFRSCRQLFAETIKHVSSLGKERPSKLRELYELIILSFGHELDQAGTAVALSALRHEFGIFPNEQTTRTIVLQIARLGILNEAGIRPRRLDPSSSSTKERVVSVTKILQKFKEDRVKALLDQGIVFEDLKGDARSEEMMSILLDMLRYVVEVKNTGKASESSTNSSNESRRAAEKMGVPDFDPWKSQRIV
jgi:hypothetical protein